MWAAGPPTAVNPKRPNNKARAPRPTDDGLGASSLTPALDQYYDAIPTIGLASLIAPVEPRKAALPKEKMPPSEATSQ